MVVEINGIGPEARKQIELLDYARRCAYLNEFAPLIEQDTYDPVLVEAILNLKNTLRPADGHR